VSETKEEAKRAEGKRIIEDLAKLKYELQHDRNLTYVSHPFPNLSDRLGLFLMMANLILLPTIKS
jgi:hypothetical protein